MALAPPGTDRSNPNLGPVLSPANLLPQRNPGLVRRIMRLFARAQPDMGPQPLDKDTTQTGIVSEGLISLYDRQFKFDVTRRATYKDVEEIDQASEEGSIALDTIADNVCTSDDGVQMFFEVSSKNAKVQKILDQVVRTCKLHQRIPMLVRNLLKYGDIFGEVVINGNGEITNLKQLPPITMFRNEDLSGNLLLGEPTFDKKSGKCTNGQEQCAFDQKAESSGELLASFWPWQIVHIRHQHDGFSPYGRSHMRVARVTYKKLKAIEESLIVGRLTRDILKLIFYVDTTGLTKDQRHRALQEFQQSVMQRVHVDGRRENPFSVMTDFFVSSGYIKVGQNVQPMQTKVDIIDPKNVGIHDITDVEYLHRKFTACLRVPRAHLGFEKDVNSKSTLTIQDVQYVRFLRDIQQEVGQGLEQLFDTALILAGVDPEQEEYEIIWPTLNATDQMNAAQSRLYNAQADAIYAAPPFNAIDGIYVQAHVFNMDDDEANEVNTRVAARIQQEQAMAQQQQQTQQAHEVNLATIKNAGKPPGTQGQALPNPTGFSKSKVGTAKRVQSRYTTHDKGDFDVPPTSGGRGGMNAEIKVFSALASLLGDRVENLVAVDMSQLATKLSGQINGHSNGHTGAN